MSKNPVRNHAIEWILRQAGGLSESQVTSIAAGIVAATPTVATGSVFGDVVGALLGPLVVGGIHGEEITPDAFTGDVDDFDPGDGRDALVWRLDLDGNTLTGIEAPETPGEWHVIVALTAGTIASESAGSAAANRIVSSSGDVELDADGVALLIYDGTSERWRVLSAGAGASPGSGAEDAEGAIAIRYTFSTTTTDSDPGAGVLRLSNATQYLAVTVRADLADVDGADVTALLALIGDQVSATKGYLRLQKTDDPSKWLAATVSAIATPGGGGYRNVTIANIAKSANSPFADGDRVTLVFVPGALGHHAAHEPSGADAMAVDAAAGTGSLRTLGTGSTQAAAGNHTHTTAVDVTIPFVIDGGGVVIATGLKGGIPVDFACTITGWTILSTDGTSGAIVVDVWKDSYANFPPTVADSIAGAEKPTITATNAKGQDTSLNSGSGWAIAAGDVLYFNVDSVTSLKRVVVALKAQRSI